MMKRKILFVLLLLSAVVQSQILKPVTWTASTEKVNASEFDLVITAEIDPGWHLYSQNVPDGGPIPTTISFSEPGKTFQLIGSPTEDEGHEEFDNVFEMDIKYFENKAVFKQRVRVLTDDKLTLNGVVEFMVCDDANCLPPTEIDLKFEIQGIAGQKEVVSGIELVPAASSVLQSTSSDKKTIDQEKQPEKSEKGPTGMSDKKQKSKSLWTLFILSFLAGFAALLTPCVFPMIPMTVSFFTKQSKNKAVGIRNAILFGVSIVVLYVLLGTVVTSVFGADSLNALSTNVWFNLVFFALLVIFAVSFLGAFEITLPSSWGTKVDSQADRGGLIGIFFMALALAIVSFSCTGPIVGTALVAAAAQG
ncbi:MAG: cytochrome c biogenesis protein CcdA, partial [Lutimonas sp.]